MRIRLIGLIGVLGLALMAQAQDTQLKVQLTNGLSTGTSHKGDLVTGRVTDGAAFQGDIVEGKVTDVQQGGGRAVLRFSFETLKHGGQAVPIASEVQSISNSQGQVEIDENGNALRHSNRQEKASDIARVGSTLGGLLRGRSGAAVNVASQAVAAVIMVDVSSDASSITLAPGSTVTLLARSRSGPALSSLAPNAPPGAAAAPAGSSSAPTAQPASAAPQAGGQPDLVAVKSDFVPGERVIFYDDFTDMGADEPPPHWKVRGGTAELRVGGGIRQLTMTADQVALWPNMGALPANFTMEADIAYKGHTATAAWKFHDNAGAEILQIITASNFSKFDLIIRTNKEELTNQHLEVDWSKPVSQALWVQNGRVRYYVNGQRAMDVNQIALPELGKVEADIHGPGENDPTGYVGIRFLRIAESSPDFSKVILSSGRFVTHGILFDTDSDQIKPESAPVIKMVAKGLEADPALKLRIEGHTDSVGDADHNLDLSRRRAEAVKAVLVTQFNIDASRLTTAGFGATKPVDSNDTPQGRAQNRRVEFTKQ